MIFAALIAGCVVGLALIIVAWRGVPRVMRDDPEEWDPVKDLRDRGVL